MSIYTKSGDGGYTTTIKERNVPKSSTVINLIGQIDEVNATFGLISVISDLPRIYEIQNRLFDIGACIAGLNFSEMEILSSDIALLENDIDELDKILPPLKNFILPGGNELSARFHNARTKTRVAETVLWSHLTSRTNIHIYINRLSDWCFMQARKAMYDAGLQDIIWSKNESIRKI